MTTVFDVSKYIIQKLGKMSTWKLQKLCYYSQAWHIAWTGNAIFNEDFQAWSNGPVCPELFFEYQGMYSVGIDDIKKGDSNSLTDDEKISIDVIIRDYGYMEPYDLRELSHCEDPWKDARKGIPEGQRSQNIITKGAMGEYYGSL